MTMEITKVSNKIEAQQSKQLDLGPAASSLDLLQAVYRDPTQHLSIRMRAASIAIAFESPKLAVVAQVSESDLATLLDQRIAKLRAMEQQKLIDATPIKENGGNADARLPPPIPDRRFRRI